MKIFLEFLNCHLLLIVFFIRIKTQGSFSYLDLLVCPMEELKVFVPELYEEETASL